MSASTYSVSGMRDSSPSGEMTSGVPAGPGPGALPSRLYTCRTERFQNSVSRIPFGSVIPWPR